MSSQGNNIGLGVNVSSAGFSDLLANVQRVTRALDQLAAARAKVEQGGATMRRGALGDPFGGSAPVATRLFNEAVDADNRLKVARELASGKDPDFSELNAIKREGMARAATEKAKTLTDKAANRRAAGEKEAERFLNQEARVDAQLDLKSARKELDARWAETKRKQQEEQSANRRETAFIAKDDASAQRAMEKNLDSAWAATQKAQASGERSVARQGGARTRAERNADRLSDQLAGAGMRDEYIAQLRQRTAGARPVVPLVGDTEVIARATQARYNYDKNIGKLASVLGGKNSSVDERREAIGIREQIAGFGAQRAADGIRHGAARAQEEENRNMRLSQGIIARQATLNARPLQSALGGIAASSRMQSLEAGFSAIAGNTPDDIRGLRAATGGRVGDASLIGGALRLGVQMPGMKDNERDRLLGNAARLGSVFMGSAQGGIDSAVEGVAKLSTNILDNIGVTVRLDEVTRAYAKTMGKSVQDVTEREKVEALFQETLKQTDVLVQKIGKEVGTSQASVERMTATLTRWRDKMDINAGGAGTALQTGFSAAGEAALSAGSFRFANAQGTWRERLLTGAGSALLAGSGVGIAATLLTWGSTVLVPLIGEWIASIGENTAATKANTVAPPTQTEQRRGGTDIANLLIGGR